MPSPENASDLYKKQIRKIVQGNVITVGGNGEYLTIAEALDFIATQPTMELVVTDAHLELTQWDNFIPLTNPGVDTLGDVRPGDLLYITGDDPAVDTFQYDWHYYRVHSAIQDNIETSAGILIESGVLGPSQSNVLAEIRRPAEFIVQLLDGDFDTTGATMPDGYNIKIQGLGRATTVSGTGIAMPVYGHTEFTDFIQTGGLTTFDTRTVDPANSAGNGTLLDAGFSSLHMHDMWCEGEECTIAGNMTWQSTRIKNLDLSGFKGHRIYFMMMSDFMEIENVRYDTVSAMETVEIFTHVRRQSSSWTKVVRNCKFRRSQDVSGQPSLNHRGNLIFGISMPQSGMPDYRMDFYDCVIEDNNLQAQAESGHLIEFHGFDDPTNKAIIRFINSELNNINSHNHDVGQEIGSAGTPEGTLNIEFINSYNYDVVNKTRRQITHDFSGASVPSIYYRHSGSYSSYAFNAFLVPSLSQSDSVIYEPMTANVTVLDPIGGVKGETKKLIFEQDETGGRTITWSGGSYRIHSNPVGTAGKKAVFELYNDGTHWIQIGATGWA